MPASSKPSLVGGVQAIRPSNTQNVAYTGTAGTISNAVTASVVRVMATTDCFIAVGSSPTATTSDMPLVAYQPEYFRTVPSSDKVSAIRSSVSGTLYVTEMD